jgi:hypothetical protein
MQQFFVVQYMTMLPGSRLLSPNLAHGIPKNFNMTSMNESMRVHVADHIGVFGDN